VRPERDPKGGPAYTVSIMEFLGGKVVYETQYFAGPFEAAEAMGSADRVTPR
jgi:hypothetical protein